MKETVLDVLMYLFENYLDEETDVDSDRETLRQELAQAGFPEEEIGKAFSWLEALGDSTAPADLRPGSGLPSTRVFTPQECERLDLECRGFLLFLEELAVLDPTTRERVIDRVMALESDGLDLEQLKWVVLMVLFNQPGKEAVFAWMEDLVFDKVGERLH